MLSSTQLCECCAKTVAFNEESISIYDMITIGLFAYDPYQNIITV